MNKIRLLSDLHLEFGPIDLPIMDDESNQILVLAGDIGLAARSYTYIPFLEEMSDRFQDIIYIPGNHEYYHSSIVRGLDKIKGNIKFANLHNIHAVNNEVVRIGEISFVCSTMWASYDKQSPLCMYDSNLWMNDHKLIRTGPKNVPYQRKFRADDAYEEFLKSINFIFPAIQTEKQSGQKVCVVTHHAPSRQSIAPEFAGESTNGAYASDLDYNIIEADPDVWVHGHTHTSFAYEIENTAVVCNPRGYCGETPALNPNFNPKLVISFK